MTIADQVQSDGSLATVTDMPLEDLAAIDAAQRLPASLRRFDPEATQSAGPIPATVRFVVASALLKDALTAIRLTHAEILTVEVATSALRIALDKRNVFATTVVDLPEPSNVPRGAVVRFTCQYGALAKLLGVAPIRGAGGDGDKSVTLGRVQPPHRIRITFTAGTEELTYRGDNPSPFAAVPSEDDTNVPIIRLTAHPIAPKVILPWAGIAHVGKDGVSVPAELLGQGLLFAELLRGRTTKAYTPQVNVEGGWVWGGTGVALGAFHAPRLASAQLRLETALVGPLARLLDRMHDAETRLSHGDKYALFADERLACGVATTKNYATPLAKIEKVFSDRTCSGGAILRAELLLSPAFLVAGADLYLGLRRTEEGGELIVSTSVQSIVRLLSRDIILKEATFRSGEEPDEKGLISAGWVSGKDLEVVLTQLKAEWVHLDFHPGMLLLSASDPDGSYVAKAAFAYTTQGKPEPLVSTERGQDWLLRRETEAAYATAAAMEGTDAQPDDLLTDSAQSASRAERADDVDGKNADVANSTFTS